MRYFLIAGEASGDLHATRLIEQLKIQDPGAQFYYYYHPELAYMGYVSVIMHLGKILHGLNACKQEITTWKPDCLILVDYPGFNLKIADFVHKNVHVPVFYYISPKIWAWKESRINAIRRNVTSILSILPFEKEWYAQRNYQNVRYVGNPSVEEIDEFLKNKQADSMAFRKKHCLDERPIIAILAGSRKQEIELNLSYMVRAASYYSKDYQLVAAVAPTVETSLIQRVIANYPIKAITNDTYHVLQHSTAALVTSGTATLETALLEVPQVVCYRTHFPHIANILRHIVLKVKYVSLVNLIVQRSLVKELLTSDVSIQNIQQELGRILPGGDKRQEILTGYRLMRKILGRHNTTENAAYHIISLMQSNRCQNSAIK